MSTFVWVKFKHPIFTPLFYDGYILLEYTLVIPIHCGSKYFDSKANRNMLDWEPDVSAKNSFGTLSRNSRFCNRGSAETSVSAIVLFSIFSMMKLLIYLFIIIVEVCFKI